MSKNAWDKKALLEFRDKLEKLKDNAPAVMEEIAIGEGVYAVKQARLICKNEKIVDSGAYRMNWHTGTAGTDKANAEGYDGTAPKNKGKYVEIDIYNNLDYAKHLEFGFRSHFVPVKYLSNHYRKQFPDGMYVGEPGGYVRGKYVMKRAVNRTEKTQKARITRKFEKIVKNYVEGTGNDDGK